MTDHECVQLLQAVLPRLRLRWPGFRKVRGQVGKRISQRINDLGLSGVVAYQAYLEHHPDEWTTLDHCCRITISRFYRDQAVFRILEQHLLPELASSACSRGQRVLRCWCAGCAAGEEPYSLAILWRLRLQERFPGLRLDIVATDVDEVMLKRARLGVYQASSLREMPPSLLHEAFEGAGGNFRLRAYYRDLVQFVQQDLRHGRPAGRYDLILCRNCAFTYFEESLQREILATIAETMVAGGLLVIGGHERLPQDGSGLEPLAQSSGIYRKRDDPCRHKIVGP